MSVIFVDVFRDAVVGQEIAFSDVWNSTRKSKQALRTWQESWEESVMYIKTESKGALIFSSLVCDSRVATFHKV